MPYKSRWSVTVPNVSIPAFLFGPHGNTLPDKVVLADAARPSTHNFNLASWYLWSRRVAVGLRNAGLQPGDRVLLFSGNTLFFPVIFMGILMAEGIFTGANPTYVARELAHQLRDSGATFVVTADENGSLETAIEAAEQVSLAKDRIFIFDDETFEGKGDSRLGARHWNALIASEDEGNAFVPSERIDPKATTACLNYSSGTTGVAKGVKISHFNYVANTSQVVDLARQEVGFAKSNSQNRWLCFIPMYHAMGQAIFIMNGPLRGIPVYIMKKYDFIQMLETVEKFKITELILVPPLVVAMAKHPASRKYDLSSVNKVLCGAAPLGREVSIELESLWPKGQVNLKQGWGQTELTCSMLGWDPNQIADSASVGELNANCSAKIMDDDGITEVPHGQRGELYVRGPNVMQGYWNNEKATAETITPDGWLKTGDICFVDQKGYFNVVDRKKELIKVKGNQVAPAELEALLLEHPSISDAAVIGHQIDHEEYPRAYIVLQPTIKNSKSPTPEEIANWLTPKVARHKRLLGGVKIVDSIPKNPSGKILRKVLREMAAKEVGDLKARL